MYLNSEPHRTWLGTYIIEFPWMNEGRPTLFRTSVYVACNCPFWGLSVYATSSISGIRGETCSMRLVNTLGPRQNGRHVTDDIFKCIFVNENVWIPIKISLKLVHNGPINNIPALVQIMAWCRAGAKPLSEPMMVSLLTHICVPRPHWVKQHHVLVFLTLSVWFGYILPINCMHFLLSSIPYPPLAQYLTNTQDTHLAL